MKTAKDVHDLCNKARNQRRADVKVVLTDWLEILILHHKRWRAVIGNKRCKPIPIHRDFKSEKSREPYVSSLFNRQLTWPDLPDEEIREVIESLGFVVSGETHDLFCLSVPPCENGKPLTFAQEWVNKINHSYSLYVAHEKKKAEFFYHVILLELCEMPAINVRTCDGYTFFEGYQFFIELSDQCYHYILTLLARDGIEPYSVGCSFGLRALQQ